MSSNVYYAGGGVGSGNSRGGGVGSGSSGGGGVSPGNSGGGGVGSGSSGGGGVGSGKENNVSTSCFVATAAFGTPWADEINFLRKWRDERLKYSRFGRSFISVYYKNGPVLAKWIGGKKIPMAITRSLIRTIIKFMR